VKDIIQQDKDFNFKIVDANDTVAEVINTLGQNKILSVPVRDSSTGSFVGIVDMLDLITLCVTKFSKVSLLALDSYQQMEEFAEKKVKDVLNISLRDQPRAIQYNAPLTELMTMLSQKNVHRVAVTNEVKDVVGMMTQSRLVEYLYNNKDKLKEKMTVTNASTIAHKPVETINMNEFVIEAFKKIWEKEVSGIAVVDNDGKLVGNISASDLNRTHVKPIGGVIHDLYQPIKQFNNIRVTMQERVMMAEMPKYEPITVNPDDTLDTVMKTTIDKRVHRVYWTDTAGKPVGVISLSDLIQSFASESP
jgi:CBS domain-containing protein